MVPAAAGGGGAAGPGAGGGAGASRASSRAVEEQHVWIYCLSHEETESILTFCRNTEHVRRIPEEVASPPEQAPEWRAGIKLRLHEPPPCYGAGAWKEFLSDVDALLGASCASVAFKRCQELSGAGAAALDAMRWPSVLVTDRRKLCQAVCDDFVRTVLAEAARLQLREILTVVLAADFKTLCGCVTEEAPMELSGSVALADAQPPAGMARKDVEFELSVGVYVQSCVGAVEGKAGGTIEAAEAEPKLGARCLAVLGPGRCAYSAVSADGLRRMDISGSWEVVNGHLLVGGGSGPGRTSVTHLELYPPAPRPLPCGAGEPSSQPPTPARPSSSAVPAPRQGLRQPVIIGLDELRNSFEPPAPLSTLMGDLPEAVRAACAHACPSSADAGGRAVRRGSVGSQQPGAEASMEARRLSCASVNSACDYLITCPRLEARSSLDFEPPASARPSLGQASPVPLQPVPPSTARSPVVPSRRSSLLSRAAVTQAWDAAAGDQASSWSFPTCPLRPGTYRYEVGQEGDRNFRLFNLTLHLDGSYYYRDRHFRTLLSATSEGATWEVQRGILVLTHKKRPSGRPGFLLTMLRGKREVERRIARVEIPTALILAKCTFTAFDHDAWPFPGHEPKPASQRLGGWLDAGSLPAMADPPIDPDSMPLKDFEEQLRHLGVDLAQEGFEDIAFVDSNADGRVARGELADVAKFGAPIASGEVINELSEALVATFGELPHAFEFLQQFASAERISFQNFSEGLQQVTADKRLKPKATKLKQWLKERTQEEMEAVFSALNPSKRPRIGLVEFLAMNLHTALLALRQLEELKDFLFQKFGRGEDALLAAFEAIDTKHKHELTDKTLEEGLKKIGFKHAHCDIFGLLDRSFSGKVTPLEFLALGDLSTKQLLGALEALKAGALQRFDSLGDCFGRLLEAEREAKRVEEVQQLRGGALLVPPGAALLAPPGRLGDRRSSSKSSAAGSRRPSKHVASRPPSRAAEAKPPSRPPSRNGSKGRLPSKSVVQSQEEVLPGVSLEVLVQEHEKGTLGSGVPARDLPLVLLFLGEAGCRHRSDGRLILSEWRLLEVFDSCVLSGNPTRFRECLERRFGAVENAFPQIQGSWLPRIVGERLRQAALEGLLAALASASPPQARKPRQAFKAGEATPTSAGLATPMSARASTRNLSEATQRPHTHCGIRSQSVRESPSVPRGAAMLAWSKPAPCKQVKGLTEARMPTTLRSESWTPQPRIYHPAWPVNEEAGAGPSPRRSLLPGLASKPTPWGRPGAISAINWGVV